MSKNIKAKNLVNNFLIDFKFKISNNIYNKKKKYFSFSNIVNVVQKQFVIIDFSNIA